MSSYNRVTLVGNLTRQPELRKTKNGTPVAELGIALNRSWNGENGQKQEETTYVDVTVWGRSAENAAQYLQKGRSVLIEGRLQMETWQDKQSGEDRSKLRVVAESVQFLGSSHDAERPDREEERHERRERSDQRADRREDRGEERRDAHRGERRPEPRTDSKRERRYASA